MLNPLTSAEPTFTPHLLKCENLVPPKNGFLQYSHSLDEGSVVTYSCIKGFEIRQRGSTRKVPSTSAVSVFMKLTMCISSWNFHDCIFSSSKLINTLFSAFAAGPHAPGPKKHEFVISAPSLSGSPLPSSNPVVTTSRPSVMSAKKSANGK